MGSTDYLRLNKYKIFEEFRESLPKDVSKTMNLVNVHDDVLFTWDFQNNCVLSLNLKAARGKNGDNIVHQGLVKEKKNNVITDGDKKEEKLLPLHPPLFSPEFIIVNDSGTLLAVAGPCGVLVLELPAKCPPYGAYDNNKEVVYCNSHSLDERLLACSDTVAVRQAKFHPGALYNNYILVLISDNTLRLYQIENHKAFNIKTYEVGEKPAANFPGSKTPFLDIYGEVAVDFDFGHPEVSDGSPLSPVKDYSLILSKSSIEDKYLINAETQTLDKIIPKKLERDTSEKKGNNVTWPVYILRSDMSIYIIEMDVKKKIIPILKGPIPMISFEEEQTDACSLICLNTVPQVFCIAMTNGTICHSILLDIDDDHLFEMKEIGKYRNNLPNKELLAFETIELELGLATCEEDLDSKYKCPIFLKKDESTPGRYYATHSAGVHSVFISCIDNLQDFVNSHEDTNPTADIFSNLTKAEYLVCTKTAASDKSNPVIGFALYYEPSSVITLLSDGSLVTLGVMYVGCLPKIQDLIINEDTESTSPLKKMLQEPFDQYIQKILKKTPTQPVLKLPVAGENNLEANYELLQRAAQVFRDEYFKNHQRAKEELEKRIHTLTIMKKNQLKELEIMKRNRDELQEQASNLAEKYEDIKDKQDDLLKKAENLLMLVSRKRSSPSEAEKDFLKELNESSLKIGTYGQRIDKIKNKLKYQQVQMENWKSQEIKKISALNETHASTIKNNLEECTKKIKEMMKQVNEFKRQLDLK